MHILPIYHDDFSKSVIPLIKSARRNIDICVYDWRWYFNRPSHPTQEFNLALVAAARRGVQVRAVVNHSTYVPDLQKVGILAKSIKDSRVLHAKFMVIDGKKVVLGSHNYTSNAFTNNLEVSLAFEDQPTADSLLEFFNRLYNL